ncbi:hypothetical protein FXV91_13580 [Methanosarcina sp. DH2]|uniref:hypothetical protein n=1 Tax=Methanosarcina sp. DH2 TaxID=2605639 RepID=UPI001E2E9887|nr:hypothetical protein [Methanosarcina sp. DH2]MCC4771157.1 hypothetical protein [Methanosarcina sp. DH2]
MTYAPEYIICTEIFCTDYMRIACKCVQECRHRKKLYSSKSGGIFIIGFYEQKAAYSKQLKLLMFAGLLLILAFYIFSRAGLFGFDTDPDERYALPLILLIYLTAMWSFFGMKFLITSDSVVAFFPPFRYSIPFSDISSVEIMEEFPWYMGWGVRIWGRKLIFVGKHAKGVAIRKNKGFFRTVILVSESPDEFRKRVEMAMR